MMTDAEFNTHIARQYAVELAQLCTTHGLTTNDILVIAATLHLQIIEAAFTDQALIEDAGEYVAGIAEKMRDALQQSGLARAGFAGRA